jgi:hypothetical protein
MNFPIITSTALQAVRRHFSALPRPIYEL